MTEEGIEGRKKCRRCSRVTSKGRVRTPEQCCISTRVTVRVVEKWGNLGFNSTRDVRELNRYNERVSLE